MSRPMVGPPAPGGPASGDYSLGLPILTDRLELRWPRDGDVEDIHVIYESPEVARYLYEEPFDLDGARAWIERAKGYSITDKGGAVNIVGVLRETGHVVATYMVALRSTQHWQGEVGYVVSPAYAGRGLATEGARAMLAIGFDRLGCHRMTGQCDARNDASAAVLRRLGMREEAHLVENEWVKGEWTDEKVFAMLRTEWQSR